MSLQWISRLVIVLLVTVVLSEAILIPNNQNAAKVCEELQSGERKILAMGARKKESTEDANFYVLASGGYLYTLSLSNLVIGEREVKRNFSLTIDQVYIDASKLFRLPESDFCLENGSFNYRFFFISSYDGPGFLGRMLQNKTSTHMQLHWLNGTNARRVQMNKVSQDIPFLASWRTDGDEVWGYQVQSVANSVNVAWKYTFRFQIIGNNEQLEPIGPHGQDNVVLRLPENVQIYTGFYIELNGYTYFFILYNDSVTITKASNDKMISGEEGGLEMEIKLSEFIVCQYTQTPASKAPTKTSSTTETTENDDPLKWYFILVTIVIWAILLLVLLYCGWTYCRSKNKDKKKRKDKRNRKKINKDVGSSNQSSDTGLIGTSSNQSAQSDQNASTALSTAQKIPNSKASRKAKSPRKSKSAISKITKTIKSELSSILSVNKSKAAKSVNKANGSKKKRDKSKASKGSKAGNTKDGKPKKDGPKDGGPKPDQSSSP